MFTNVAVSAIFVIIAVVVFILLCFKGMHTGIAALIAAFIAAFGSADSLATSLFVTFPSGVGSLVTMMFFVFTASGLFATMMEKTGCAMSVGKTMGVLTDRSDNGFQVAQADAYSSAANGSCPVLFLLGEENEYVPAEQTQTLYDAWGGEKELLSFPSRNGLIYAENTQEIQAALDLWMARYAG